MDSAVETRLVKLMNGFKHNPVGFVRAAYPWGSEATSKSSGPRQWQNQVLEKIGNHLKNPATRFQPLQIAVSSGHGIGKSALVSMVIDWAMSTCADTKIVVTANTESQLRVKTWPEVTHWSRMSLVAHWFKMTATAMASNDADHERIWRADAIPWNAENVEAFAGLHNKGRRIVIVFDESSAIDDKIWEVAEGALTDADTEIIWLAFGNPTRNVGRFKDCFEKLKHRWVTFKIDSRTVEGTNKELFNKFLEDYGEDSDFFRVRVKGEFPRAGTMQFIASNVVEDARLREAVSHIMDPLIMGVDVARFGDDECFDDETEILTNNGWKYFADLESAEKILTLNGDVAEWGDIDKIHKHVFDGELNLYESSKANFCVTDNHNFLVRTHAKSEKYALRKYAELPEDYCVRAWNDWTGIPIEEIYFETIKHMPNGGTTSYSHKFSGVNWAKFLGWFLSEGNVYRETRKSGRYRILLAQNPGKKQEEIKSLLTRMGINWRLVPSERQIEFSSLSIGSHLLDSCGHGAANKRIPDYMKNASPLEMRAFLDAFLMGDGTCRDDNKGRMYYSSSKGMIDDLQEMLAKLGCAGGIAAKEMAGSEFFIDGRKIIRHHDTYVLYERSSKASQNPENQHCDKFLKKSKAKKIPYKGFVWCVSTKHQTIYVRRKGIPMWSGNSVIVIRRGRDARTIPWIRLRGVDTMSLAARIAELANEHKPDAIFVDEGGVGGGVVDRLRQLRFAVIGVQFGSSADKSVATSDGMIVYLNKRAEIWGSMRDWLKGGAIPNDQTIEDQLVGVEYGYTLLKGKDAIQLEKKKDMKKRLGFSSDLSDALALTFSYPVQPSDHSDQFGKKNSGSHTVDYDPLSREACGASGHQAEYNPLGRR